jgi:predicted metalloprotease
MKWMGRRQSGNVEDRRGAGGFGGGGMRGIPRTRGGIGIIIAFVVIGSLMGSSPFQVLLPRLVSLYQQGRLMLDELVSAKIPLTAINEGYAAMAQGEVARSVIVF